jgi:hypothetical protein
MNTSVQPACVTTVWALMATDPRAKHAGEPDVWCERVYKLFDAASHQAAVNNERDKEVAYWVEPTEFEGWDG